mgnify:CR=1 FL=1
MARSLDLKTVITRGEKTFLVSTVSLPFDLWGDGFETMVFACDPEGRVESWSDLLCQRASTLFDARASHNEVCDTFQS